jgi:hypothetical protein
MYADVGQRPLCVLATVATESRQFDGQRNPPGYIPKALKWVRTSPGASMPVANEPPGSSATSWEDADDSRRVAHELVGQAHAVLVLAYRDDVLALWCLPEVMEAAKNAAPELWLAIGEMQAAIAGGTHDEGIAAAGIGGRVSRPKWS